MGWTAVLQIPSAGLSNRSCSFNALKKLLVASSSGLVELFNVSDIRCSTASEPFDRMWNRADPLDIVALGILVRMPLIHCTSFLISMRLLCSSARGEGLPEAVFISGTRPCQLFFVRSCALSLIDRDSISCQRPWRSPFIFHSVESLLGVSHASENDSASRPVALDTKDGHVACRPISPPSQMGELPACIDSASRGRNLTSALFPPLFHPKNSVSGRSSISCLREKDL